MKSKVNSLIMWLIQGRISLTFFLIFISSCVAQREIEYLQDRDRGIKGFDEAELSEYKLKPDDELYIQIRSLDEAAANIFSASGTQQYVGGSLTPYGASLTSYTVDRDGYLLMPVIGNIQVKDKTISQVKMILKDSLNHILNLPSFTIKLVNRYVSIIGEVRNPGHYAYSQEKITIYDAIGLAGDITDYGNRRNIILIRNEDKENLRINIDLTKSEILSSVYYNLKPNDIVYVKPLQKKLWGMRQFPFSVIFSTITTGLLIYNIFK
jgi:polysaccharide export outer membrane protein